MKTPSDAPIKPGERVRLRGRDRLGTTKGYVRQVTWFNVAWDDGRGPFICHQNELQVIHEGNPGPDHSRPSRRHSRLALSLER